MQVVIEEVNPRDNNLVNIFSFNASKDYEATESLEFVQNAFAQLRKDNIGSNEGKALRKYCHNIKTAVRSVVEEGKILPLVEEVLAKVYSKLQGKAVRDYEVKLVRLIRDQKSWTIQA